MPTVRRLSITEEWRSSEDRQQRAAALASSAVRLVSASDGTLSSGCVCNSKRRLSLTGSACSRQSTAPPASAPLPTTGMYPLPPDQSLFAFLRDAWVDELRLPGTRMKRSGEEGVARQARCSRSSAQAGRKRVRSALQVAGAARCSVRVGETPVVSVPLACTGSKTSCTVLPAAAVVKSL